MSKMVYDVYDDNYNIKREKQKKWQNKIDKRRKVKQKSKK